MHWSLYEHVSSSPNVYHYKKRHLCPQQHIEMKIAISLILSIVQICHIISILALVWLGMS